MSNVKKYIIVTDWMETFVAQEYWLFAKGLETLGWTLLKIKDVVVDDIKKQKSIVVCDTSDFFDIGRLKCDNVHLIYKMDDFFPYKTIRNDCISNCDTLVSSYQYLCPTLGNVYKGILNKPSYWSPHCAIHDFFDGIMFNTNPNSDKIFVSGAVSDTYPLRMYVVSDPMFTNIIDRLRHPSYNVDTYRHDVMNKKYYERLNMYLCCFCDALTFKYLLMKVFEITAVGSLLLVEDSIKEPLRELGFINMETCILCNKENIYDIMEWILDKGNRIIVDIIRKKGMELTRSRHTLRHRVEVFNSWIDETFV